jgi:hypothetical protein
MPKRKSPQPARAPLDETSREEEWSDWQNELLSKLRDDRVIWFHRWLTKPPPTSIHYLVTPDCQYFEVEQNSVLEKWRWRGISHDECERLTKHYLEHGGYDEQWDKVFGLENSEELASDGAEHPADAGPPGPVSEFLPPSDDNDKFHSEGPPFSWGDAPKGGWASRAFVGTQAQVAEWILEASKKAKGSRERQLQSKLRRESHEYHGQRPTPGSRTVTVFVRDAKKYSQCNGRRRKNPKGERSPKT